MKKNIRQAYSVPAAPIRGPEWSNAKSLAPLFEWNLCRHGSCKTFKSQKDRFELKFDRCIQQLQKAICTHVPGLVQKPPQTQRNIGEKAVSEKCLFAATNTDDFRKLKEELSATGVVNINNAVIISVVGDHECLHINPAEMQKSWGPRAA